MYKLPERGGGGVVGGEVIWAMPERKHSFFKGGVPLVLSHTHNWKHVFDR